jgi:hypothetical protein
MSRTPTRYAAGLLGVALVTATLTAFPALPKPGKRASRRRKAGKPASSVQTWCAVTLMLPGAKLFRCSLNSIRA